MTNQLATFELDGDLYGVDVQLVQEALLSPGRTAVPMAPAAVAGLTNLRGQVVLTVDLRVRLGLPSAAEQADRADQMMVVVQVDDVPVGLLVDAVGDVIDVDDDLFESPPETLDLELRSLITGAYKLEGRLLLALDVARATSF